MGLNDLVLGVPLIIVVMSLVEFVKSLQEGFSWKMVISMGIGLALGIAYWCSKAVPVTYPQWFEAVIFGLLMGLAASGFYHWSDKFSTPSK
jgi:hypothetical protein